MRHWLFKSEPSTFSIDDLAAAPDQTTCWDGVRNYQARNFMRDDMQVGDAVLFYHSSCDDVGVVGLAEVSREAYTDPTALDPEDSHHDPKATPDNPRWCMVDIRFVRKFPSTVPLTALKDAPGLEKMLVVQRGQRLSIQPVTPEEFAIVLRMAQPAG